jgi:hypothetical protein
MKHGHFHTRPGATQADGLYVDPDGRIFLWPMGPNRAYEIDEELAAAWTMRETGREGRITFLFVPLLVAAAVFLILLGEGLGSRWFSGRGVVIFSLLAGYTLALPAIVALRRVWIPRRFISALEAMGIAAQSLPRPPAQPLKPSIQLGGWRVSIALGLLPLVSGLLLALALVTQPPLGDLLALLLATGLCLAVLLVLAYRQITGQTLGGGWIYTPTEDHPHPLGPPGQTGLDDWRALKGALPKPDKRERRRRALGWAATLGLGALIGVGLAEYTKEPLTPERLADLYEQAAFPGNEDRVLKWTRPGVAITLPAFSDPRMTEALRDQLAQTFSGAGLSWIQGASERTITVVALDGERLDAQGEPNPMGATFTHDDGALTKVVITISLTSLRMAAPDDWSRDRDALFRRMATTGALWAVGLRGQIDTDRRLVNQDDEPVRPAIVLPTIHYSRAIHAGQSKDDAMAAVRTMALPPFQDHADR